jgi:hypothetical protein
MTRHALETESSFNTSRRNESPQQTTSEPMRHRPASPANSTTSSAPFRCADYTGHSPSDCDSLLHRPRPDLRDERLSIRDSRLRKRIGCRVLDLACTIGIGSEVFGPSFVTLPNHQRCLLFAGRRSDKLLIIVIDCRLSTLSCPLALNKGESARMIDHAFEDCAFDHRQFELPKA